MGDSGAPAPKVPPMEMTMTMRVTEVVHRYGDDRTTVLHMGNMERSLMVLADDPAL